MHVWYVYGHLRINGTYVLYGPTVIYCIVVDDLKHSDIPYTLNPLTYY